MSAPLVSAQQRREREQIRRLGIASLLEASTLILLLFVAVPLKHLAGWSAAVAIVGPVHGLAFLAFLWISIETAAGGECSRREVARLVLMAFIPFGGFASFVFLRRKVVS
jgi:integral membrane protein